MVKTTVPVDPPVKAIQPEQGLRYYGCALDGTEVPDGCYASGSYSRGKLVGVRVWQHGTCDDGAQGLVEVHQCGKSPEMDEATEQVHRGLRGELADGVTDGEAG